MFFIILPSLIIIAGIILFRIFQQSEHAAAERLEKPTQQDLAEANISPHLPVADPNGPQR